MCLMTPWCLPWYDAGHCFCTSLQVVCVQSINVPGQQTDPVWFRILKTLLTAVSHFVVFVFLWFWWIFFICSTLMKNIDSPLKENPGKLEDRGNELTLTLKIVWNCVWQNVLVVHKNGKYQEILHNQKNSKNIVKFIEYDNSGLINTTA